MSTSTSPFSPPPKKRNTVDLTSEQIMLLIDFKIKQHEFRVAVISGILGGIVTAGLFHAIWLNHIAVG